MKIKSEILEEEHASDHIHWDTNHWGSNAITHIKSSKNDSSNSYHSPKRESNVNEELQTLLQKLQKNVEETNRLVEQIKKLGI